MGGGDVESSGGCADVMLCSGHDQWIGGGGR